MQTIFEQKSLDGAHLRILPKLQMSAPQDIDFSSGADTKKVGEYTLSPVAILINFALVEPKRIIVSPVEGMQGKTLVEVGRHVIETYNANCHILGIEYCADIFRRKIKVPDIFEANCQYYFFGSTLRGWDGKLSILGACFGDYDFEEHFAIDLESPWGPRDRVVLLEKR